MSESDSPFKLSITPAPRPNMDYSAKPKTLHQAAKDAYRNLQGKRTLSYAPTSFGGESSKKAKVETTTSVKQNDTTEANWKEIAKEWKELAETRKEEISYWKKKAEELTEKM